MRKTMPNQIVKNYYKTRRAHLYILCKNGAFSEGSLPYRRFCTSGKLAPEVQQEELHSPCADYIGYPLVDLPPPNIILIIAAVGLAVKNVWR